MAVHTDFVVVVRVGNGGIETDGAVLLVVHGAYLKPVLVAANEPGLLTAVAGGASAHDRGLHKDAGSAVGVGPVLGVNGGEGDGVLVVLAQVEVSREPRFDGAVLTHELDELAALLVVRVVEPAAAIDHMVLLQHAQSRSVGRGVRKDKDLPPVGGWVVNERLLEPGELRVVDGDLVRGVLGLAKDGGSEAHQQRLVGNEARELRRGLAVLLHKDVEVLLVRVELVQALEVVVAANDLVGHAEAAQVLRGQLVALGGAGKELRGLLGSHGLGLSEVSQRAQRHVAVRLLALLQDGHPLRLARLVVLHLAGVHV
mmetsp:Transcript_3508/g.6415  ORF Transcript_3508/g.6415 Transcript_3508/m.6415 type:complete len:313 (+) Transcript_3508:763-1701(+)